jgi:hypothetical protein
MKPYFLTLCRVASLPAAGALAADSAADYPWQVPLVLQGKGPWYRLQVPMAVQLAAAHADLRDLRVFNQEGEALPYALSDAVDERNSAPRDASVRLFPLYGATADPGAQANLRIQRRASGTLVEVLPDAAPAAAGEQRRGWLLDAGTADFPFERLLLDWNSPSEGFQHFRIEASDDLRNWQPWGDGQLARLSFNGERMDVSEVALPGRKARYLRLSWPANEPAVELTSARLQGHSERTEAAPLVWSPPFAGQRDADGAYRWELPLALPLERVKVALDPAQSPLMVPVALSGRAEVKDANGQAGNWWPLARGVLYSLPIDGRQARQDELALNGAAVRQLRLVPDARGTGLGAGVPDISVAMRARELVFLIRGSAPYRLALGNGAARAASLPLSVLIPAYSAEKAAALGQAQLQEALAPASVPSRAAPLGRDWKRVGLWVVLLAGVLLLAGMALSLVRGKA